MRWRDYQAIHGTGKKFRCHNGYDCGTVEENIHIELGDLKDDFDKS